VVKETKRQEVINGQRVRRLRKKSFTYDAGNIYQRVKDFADTWDAARTDERDDRIQRQAKFRQWTEGKDWPWPDASDIKLPDMTTASLRVQDTLHNAIMSARPPVTARATDKLSSEKAEKIDQLIDHQLFVDMNGENFISELADAFANDGHYVVFVPWVRERSQISDIMKYPKIPPPDAEGNVITPEEYFQTIIKKAYSGAPSAVAKNAGLWDYAVTLADDTKVDVSFYTDESDRVEMVSTRFATVFDGPSPRVMDWENVLYPPRAANLQAPSPANPKGAQAVILVDNPTLDEVKKLHKKGWYDGLDKDDIKALEAAPASSELKQSEEAKDTFSGVSDTQKAPIKGAESHKELTRYTVFDRFDIDGDGLDEDVIWWVIKELPGKVAKAQLMSEMYPFQLPRRPLAHTSYIPIRGRIGGISQLELTEGTHDAMKMSYDQMADAGTIANVPFFFYRASGGMRPETIELTPGEGYPVGDPQRDVFFPNIQNNAAVNGQNTIGLLTNMQEKLTMVGDQQLGRVPAGGATALRTVTGMAMMQNNGDARPERIMRRFYMGLRDIYSLCHQLNEVHLPPNKMVRLAQTADKNQAPYTVIQTPAELRGNFVFDFDANAFNTSRQALQDAMERMMSSYISDINLQLGIIDQDGIYRLQRDWGRIIGQDPDQYLSMPSPDSTLPKIFAEDALLFISQGKKPFGVPAEAGGAAEHLQKLQEFIQTDQFGLIQQEYVETIMRPYMEQVSQRALLQQQQAQQLEAAGNAGTPAQANAPGRPPGGVQENPNDAPTNVQPNQPADQTQPGANGNGTGNAI
jgi:hypothetical protein